MGIFGAMSTAISGLVAQSSALEHISDNIANTQTTGFKRSETSFSEIVTDSNPTKLRAGVVLASSRPTNTVQGDIQGSNVATHMAINGDGYFIVDTQTGTADGNPVFGGVDRYTRRGDFEVDRNGNLVNGSGYFLKGIPLDPVTGNATGTLPEVVSISNDFLPASATSRIDYRANLPALPLTSNYDPLVANSELLTAAAFTGDPTTAGAGTVRADESDLFLERSVAGGAITTYDSAGAPVNVQFRWGKIDSVGAGGSDSWNLFYLTDSTASGATTAWQNSGQNYVFGTNGQLSPAVASTTITGLTVDGISLGNMDLQHGTAGLTQFADSNGSVQVTDIDQNGYTSGSLVDVAISDDERLTATYSNGETVDLAEITLASFNGDNALQKLDGGAYAATVGSGAGSNSDIADEFTKLIVTQQAYAAGTRIVTTGDEMLQEALNMVR